MKKGILIVGVIILLLISGVRYVTKEREIKSSVPHANQVAVATTTKGISTPVVVTTTTEKKFLPYGKTTLRVKGVASFTGVSITLLSVFADSRCPEGVSCIWAGTVKAKLGIVSGLGAATQEIELGKTITTESETITFTSVEPAPKQGVTLEQKDYVVTITVVPRKKETVISSGCYVSGCSSQICSDTKNVVSTCEYREEYACYKKATCGRQKDGKCGWILTSELMSCLKNSQQLQ